MKNNYDVLLEQAIASPCQKRGFGCVLELNGEVIAITNNHDIDDISHLCKPKCIRFSMPSGSESMVGDCGHAEEHAIWETIRKLGSAKGAKLWILGVSKPDNAVLENPKFYCVRCATLMRYAGVEGVYCHSEGEWHWITTEEAYNHSLEYSTKGISR